MKMVFYVDVGNMPPKRAHKYLKKFRNKLMKKTDFVGKNDQAIFFARKGGGNEVLALPNQQ